MEDMDTTFLALFVGDGKLRKRAFYLDGKLYFTMDNWMKPPGIRGAASFAQFSDDGSELILASLKTGTQIHVPITAEVRFINDVATLNGNTSKLLGQNRLLRYAHPFPSNISTYLQERTRFGVVDYRIIEDNTGAMSKREYDDTEVERVKSSILKIPADTTFIEDRYILQPYNTPQVEQDVSLVVGGSDFRVVGKFIAFTSEEASLKHKGWV